MTLQPSTLSIIALVVAVVALVVAMYTQHKLKKHLAWSWQGMANRVWTGASHAWNHMPPESRDRIRRRVQDMADQGLSQLESAAPLLLRRA
jgi:hypothetical protein